MDIPNNTSSHKFSEECLKCPGGPVRSMSVAMSHGMRDAQRFETISEQCLWQWLTEYLTCVYKNVYIHMYIFIYYQSYFHNVYIYIYITFIYIYITYYYIYIYMYCIYIYMYHEDGSDYQWTPLNRVAPRINIGELSTRQDYTCSLLVVEIYQWIGAVLPWTIKMYQNVRFYMILWNLFTNINHKLPTEPTKISLIPFWNITETIMWLNRGSICALDALELGEPGGEATGEPGGEPGLGAQPRKCRFFERDSTQKYGNFHDFHWILWDFPEIDCLISCLKDPQSI